MILLIHTHHDTLHILLEHAASGGSDDHQEGAGLIRFGSVILKFHRSGSVPFRTSPFRSVPFGHE